MSEKRQRKIELEMEMLGLQKQKLEAAPAPAPEAQAVDPAPAAPAQETSDRRRVITPEGAKTIARFPKTAKFFMEGGDLVRTGLRSLVLDTLDMPENLSNLAVQGIEHLSGNDLSKYKLKTKTEKNPWLKEIKDLSLERWTPKGENKELDSAHVGAEWGAGILNPFGAGKKADLLMGGMAAGGDYIAGENGQYAGMVPAVAGIVQALRGKAKAPNDEDKAVRFIDEMMEDTPSAQENLAASLANKEVGTLSDLTGSPALYNVEKTLGPQGSKLSREVEAKNAISEAKIVADVNAAMPNTPPETSVRAAVERVEGIQARIAERSLAQQEKLAAAAGAKQEVSVAQEAADTATIADAHATAAALRGEALAAQEPFTQGKLPHEASNTLSGSIEMNRQNMKAAADAEWAKFDKSPPVDASEVVNVVHDRLNKAIPDPKGADLVKFKKAYGAEMDIIAGWRKKLASPTSIQAVLRDLKAKRAEAGFAGKKGYEHTVAGKVIDALETALIEGATTKNFGNAIGATKRMFDTALPEKIKKIVRHPNTETVAKRIGFTGEEGANTVKLLLRAEDGGRTLKGGDDYVRAMAGQEGATEKFMTKYAGYLSHRPELKAELQKVVDKDVVAGTAEKAAKTTETGLAKTIKASESRRTQVANTLAADSKAVRDKAKAGRAHAGKGIVGDYSKSPEGTEVITGLLTGKDKGTKGLKELMGWASKNDVGDSFKSNVRQALIHKLFPEKAGVASVSVNAVDTFHKVKKSLVDSGVMTPKDVARIETALAKTSRQTARAKAGNVAVEPKATKKEKMAAVIAAIGVTSTAGLPHALIFTRVIRDGILDASKEIKLPASARAKVEDFIVNPEKYAEAVSMLKEYKKGGKALTRANNERVIRAVIATSQAVKPED